MDSYDASAAVINSRQPRGRATRRAARNTATTRSSGQRDLHHAKQPQPGEERAETGRRRSKHHQWATSMGHQMGHLEAVMITDINQGLRAVSAKPLVRAAEARGFEPRMGANPNRISSPFPAPKATVSRRCPPQSVQVSEVMPCKGTEAVAVRRNDSWAISGPSQTLIRLRPPVARTHPVAAWSPIRTTRRTMPRRSTGPARRIKRPHGQIQGAPGHL
jgi:hypothetical protein